MRLSPCIALLASTLATLASSSAFAGPTPIAAEDAALAPTEIDAGLDPATELDWSLLEIDRPTPLGANIRRLRRNTQPISGDKPVWSSARHDDGSAGVTIRRPLPFAQSRVGIDMTVAGQPTNAMILPLPEKLAPLPQSGGSAWAAATLGGVGALWDHTALESRLDPAQGQGSLNAVITKTVRVTAFDGARLTLQSRYHLSSPVGVAGERYAEYGQTAKLGLASGTSLLIEQTRSSLDDTWLTRAGAEQSIAGGLSMTGMIGQTADGTTAMSLTAGFRQSW